jgi:hypothetical protein
MVEAVVAMVEPAAAVDLVAKGIVNRESCSGQGHWQLATHLKKKKIVGECTRETLI